MARSLAGRMARAWAEKHLPAWALKSADAVRGEYVRRTHTSVTPDDFYATCRALGDGDFIKGLNLIKSMPTKQLKHLKF